MYESVADAAQLNVIDGAGKPGGIVEEIRGESALLRKFNISLFSLHFIFSQLQLNV